MPSSRCEKHRSRAAPQRRFRGVRLCRSPCADTRGHTGVRSGTPTISGQRVPCAADAGGGTIRPAPRSRPPFPDGPAARSAGSAARNGRRPRPPRAVPITRPEPSPRGVALTPRRPHSQPAPLGPAQTARGTAPPLERLQAAPRAQQPPPPSRGCRFRGGAATGNGVWRRVADHCSCGYWKLLAFEYVCVEDANGAINTAVTWIKALIKRSEFIDSAYVPFLQFANGTVRGSPPPDRARSAMAARVQLAAKTRQGLSSPFNWQRRLPYKKQHR